MYLYIRYIHYEPNNSRYNVRHNRPPGSGKSTLAYPLADALNSFILGHPPTNPSHIETPVSSLLAEGSSQQGNGEEVALTIGLDGWHYRREELDGFDDPQDAHWRRVSASLNLTDNAKTVPL